MSKTEREECIRDTTKMLEDYRKNLILPLRNRLSIIESGEAYYQLIS